MAYSDSSHFSDRKPYKILFFCSNFQENRESNSNVSHREENKPQRMTVGTHEVLMGRLTGLRLLGRFAPEEGLA
jgi:hypothetical protein